MKDRRVVSQRSFNFDLFKIVLMYSIVVFHVVSVGGGYNLFGTVFIQI